MADESDGVDEVFEGALRVGLTVAGRMAEVAARSREQAARDTRAAGEQQAQELATRLSAERSAARAQVTPVNRADWWDTAEPAAIAAAWETAKTWEHLDPDAAQTVDRIRHEVQERYGVNLDAPGGSATEIREALERRGLAQEDAAAERGRAGRDESEAVRLLADADRVDRADSAVTEPERSAIEAAGQDLYDTASRRRNMAVTLEGDADVETVEARVLADTSQGRPVDEAVSHAPAITSKPRRTRETLRQFARRGPTISH